MSGLGEIGRAGVRVIEAILRRYYRVWEFTSDPRSILRLSRAGCPRDVVLSDGTHLHKGDPLLVLHFRNEQLAAVLAGDASLETGVALVRGMRHSLRLLAEYLQAEPEMSEVRALYAEFGFLQDERETQMQRMVTRLGFEFISGERPGRNVFRRAFWDDLYSWWMMWTFNPASLKGKSFTHMRRHELWMSRERLMAVAAASRDGHG